MLLSLLLLIRRAITALPPGQLMEHAADLLRHVVRSAVIPDVAEGVAPSALVLEHGENLVRGKLRIVLWLDGLRFRSPSRLRSWSSESRRRLGCGHWREGLRCNIVLGCDVVQHGVPKDALLGVVDRADDGYRTVVLRSDHWVSIAG